MATFALEATYAFQLFSRSGQNVFVRAVSRTVATIESLQIKHKIIRNIIVTSFEGSHVNSASVFSILSFRPLLSCSVRWSRTLMCSTELDNIVSKYAKKVWKKKRVGGRPMNTTDPEMLKLAVKAVKEKSFRIPKTIKSCRPCEGLTRTKSRRPNGTFRECWKYSGSKIDFMYQLVVSTNSVWSTMHSQRLFRVERANRKEI